MTASRRAEFQRKGWIAFPREAAVADWARAAAGEAERIAADPRERARWLRCGGTWFAGVNALDNDGTGAIPGGPPMTGAGLAFAQGLIGRATALDRAQISICYPGYPKRGAEETEAAHRYRLKRDAAHVDGLLPLGPDRRRVVGERHGFVLGVPLGETPPGASPLVVWEGSHEVVRSALAAALDGVPPERWAATDVTEAYHAARRRCFDALRRVEVAAPLGGAYVLHRLALHGVAPWTAADARLRAVAYFRPEPALPVESGWWLAAP